MFLIFILYKLMPQADIGLVSSTVFFLFFSFLLGYFYWVNFVFPQIVTLFRVKNLVQNIKEKDFNISSDYSTSSRLAVSPKNYFSLTPAIILDLPSDEIPLLVNFILISLSFYFILSNILEKSHTESRDFVKSLCDFDFSSSIESANQNRLSAIKYLRSSSLISVYDVSTKWLSSRKKLVLPLVTLFCRNATQGLLNELSNKISNKKSTKLTKIFSKVKSKSMKAASFLLIPSHIKSFKIKKK